MADPALTNQRDSGEAKPLWVEPQIVVEPVRETAGDPTISDDGLGDGLFSRPVRPGGGQAVDALFAAGAALRAWGAGLA